MGLESEFLVGWAAGGELGSACGSAGVGSVQVGFLGFEPFYE